MTRILVVDDDDDSRISLRTLLESRGHTIVDAGNGREALRRVAAEAIELVITDLVMPEIEGTELIQQLRNAYPQTKIIAVTGNRYAQRFGYLAVAQHLGAHRVFLKPLDARDLLQAIAELASSND